jgi:hypothetical protein
MSFTESTPAQLIDAIYTDLSAWAAGRRGKIHVAKDLENAVTLLGNSPAGWIGVLHWQGDEPAGSGTRRSPVMENNLRIFIRANLGPTAEPDIALIRTTAACPNPILNLVEAVRTRMLSYTFPGVAAPGDRLSYKGCTDQAAVGSYLMAVYSLLFGVWTVTRMPEADELIALAPAGA